MVAQELLVVSPHWGLASPDQVSLLPGRTWSAVCGCLAVQAVQAVQAWDMTASPLCIAGLWNSCFLGWDRWKWAEGTLLLTGTDILCRVSIFGSCRLCHDCASAAAEGKQLSALGR